MANRRIIVQEIISLDGFVADGDADFSRPAFDAAVLRMRLGAALIALMDSPFT